MTYCTHDARQKDRTSHRIRNSVATSPTGRFVDQEHPVEHLGGDRFEIRSRWRCAAPAALRPICCATALMKKPASQAARGFRLRLAEVAASESGWQR